LQLRPVPETAGALLLMLPLLAGAAPSAEDLYGAHCAACHGVDRLGGTGPALLPENLGRLPRDAAQVVIRAGRKATQMPGFAGLLTDVEQALLAELIFTPLAEVPVWGEEQIRASHVQVTAADKLGDQPVWDADPLNLFVVVESGSHHVTILDGDKFEPLHRFKSRFALHGGPKFSPDGRLVYFASRDGWISKYDLYSLQLVAEVRAGINTRNLAVSGDGRYVAVGNMLPHSLVLLDAGTLDLIRVIPVADESGHSSRVSAVYDAPPRQSFILALKDLREVWEISYADAPPFYGRVHDYRDEGPPPEGRFPIRRIAVEDYLDDFFFDPEYENLIGAARDGKNGQVINLLVGRKIADVELPGLPHLASGITWPWHGTEVLATPNLEQPVVTVIDMHTWKTVKRIETLGPGFFMRSHEATPYAWVDVFSGPNRDSVHVIDKSSLEIVRTLRPEPGRTAAHVEFTRDGRYALLSIWEDDGAVLVYDARTLEVVKRLPMDKPSGKYNVGNKISHSRGTSH
jgi:mono/diheme cytochrome c family protein/WD40 repeat protein